MSQITLLDGGMGQELLKRTDKAPTPLWSTQVMLDHPGMVGEVHADYVALGAGVVTTNTYAIHRDRLRGSASNHYASDEVDLPNMEDQFEALLTRALDETEVVHGKARIAGSIGPLGASYRADLNPPYDEAVALYAEVANILAARVDLLLFETIASVEAGQTCLEAGRQTNRPVWLAYTVDDEDGTKLRSGELLKEAIETAKGADAVLVNCSAPEVIADAIDVLKGANVPIGAYGNGFQQITKAFIEGGTTAGDLSSRQDLTPAIYADYAMDWIARGASIVGGCCEVGPAHIEALSERLKLAA